VLLPAVWILLLLSTTRRAKGFLMLADSWLEGPGLAGALLMNVSRRVRDQLLLSRQLLTTPEAQQPSLSDPSFLARDLIVCYGAAELALAAICAQLDCVPDKREICLPDYFASLRKASNSECEESDIAFVAELHGVRSSSQLQSLVPDSRRWNRAEQETLEHVTRWCQQFLGVSLRDLDVESSASGAEAADSADDLASKESLSLLAFRDPERRRYECFGSADIRLGLVGLLEKGRVANVSAGGCYVTTNSPYEVGEEVEMTLHVNSMSFRVTGSVVHVPVQVPSGNRKAASPASGMGVQFKKMSEGSRTRLKELIGDLKSNAKSRVARRPGKS
jgi:Tfp pilus assembly protein PilZ